MQVIAEAPAAYLGLSEVIDGDHPLVAAMASELRIAHHDDISYARAAFEWVRDNVAHSFDAQDSRVTLSASEALGERVGLCYAKAHLLTALLRVHGIPTGLCYQRLADEDTGGQALHGLVAVYLDGAWHRQDPRGNKPGVDAQFCLDREQLAWRADPALGEVDYPDVYVDPAACVVAALRGADNVLALYLQGLPDGLTV